jgi:hypothetical protein
MGIRDNLLKIPFKCLEINSAKNDADRPIRNDDESLNAGGHGERVPQPPAVSTKNSRNDEVGLHPMK